jgi:exodeoxyribonuclease-5
MDLNDTTSTDACQSLSLLPVVLTSQQRQAVAFLVARIRAGTPLVALRGLAGTGKTTIIPALKQALEHCGLAVDIGAPTNRAAMILRAKGLETADTVHSLALEPQFTAPYNTAVAWLRLREEDSEQELPALLEPHAAQADALRALVEAYSPQRVLSSVGIHARHHLIGFGPRAVPTSTVLVIDEASMVGEQLLAICAQAYPQIILVGDPGQLPPVHDAAVLHRAWGVDLTEVHRQAQASPLLQLAYRARQGYAFWRHGTEGYTPAVFACQSVPPHQFLESPLLTWRNRTRIACTLAIRQALGYPADRAVPGEPLVCRCTDRASRVDGFFNNALFRVDSVSANDARDITVRDEMTGSIARVSAHFEELDGDCIEVDAIPFRFGYCLTAHTAQGGEWPLVYISRPDLIALSGYCWHQEQMGYLAQWAYTALTRASEQVGILAQHAFTGTEEGGR